MFIFYDTPSSGKDSNKQGTEKHRATLMRKTMSQTVREEKKEDGDGEMEKGHGGGGGG